MANQRSPRSTSASQPTWRSTAQAAEQLGITTRTLYVEIDEGRLVAYKFGRVIRLKQADIDTYLEASKIPPGSLDHLHRSASKTRNTDNTA